MYSRSVNYVNAINSTSREFECRIKIGNLTLTKKDIVNIKFSYTQPSRLIGNALSKFFELEIYSQDFLFSANQVNIEIGVNSEDGFIYIPFGVFNIENVSNKQSFNVKTTKLTGYDNMYKLNQAYFSSLESTTTISKVITEIASKSGIECSNDVIEHDYSIPKPEGYTYREVLALISGLLGCNCLIDRNGKFNFVGFNDTGITLDSTNYKSFTCEEQYYKIGKITTGTSKDNTFSVGAIGTDSMELEYQNPWITQDITDDLGNKLIGLKYYPMKLESFGDLTFDYGDKLTCNDVKGNSKEILLLGHTINFNGSLSASYTSNGDSKNKNTFNINESVSEKINRTVTELAIINKALITKLTVDDLIAKNIKVDTIEGVQANLQSILTNFISGENGQFVHLTGANVIIDEAVIKNIIAKHMTVSDLKAGQINTDKFDISSEDGTFTIKNNTLTIKDNNGNIRVQIGKDGNGNYSLNAFDNDGNIMFNSDGITGDAIKSGLIVNDMVADNANISGSKLDIDSVITEVNINGKTTFKSSVVKFDDTGQTLDVAFTQIKNKVDTAGQTGFNMFRYSKTFKKEYWNKSGQCYYVDTLFQDMCCYKAYGQWASLRQYVTLEVGKTYTVSCWAKAGATGIALSGFDSNIDENIDFGGNNVVLTTNMATYWKKYSWTFKATRSGSAYPRVESPNTDLNEGTKHFYVCGLMICEGNNTNYNENPKDNLPTHKNLFHGTGDFDDTYWKTKELNPYTNNTKYKMARVYCNPADVDTINATLYLSTLTSKQGFDFSDSNKQFIVQAVFRPSADNMKIGITISKSKINYQKQNLGSKGVWKKLYWRFRGDGNKLDIFRFENPEGGTITDYVDIALIKVSKDTTDVDDWCPHEDDIIESTHTLQTKFNVQQGQIEQLIKDTTVQTTTGETVKLKDKINEINSTVEGTTQKVSSLETTVNGDNGLVQKVSSVEQKVSDEVLSVQVSKAINKKYNIRYIRDWSNGCSVESVATANNWVEIQAITNNNINRALGKTVTSNKTLTNGEVITNGKLDSDKTAYGFGEQYVQIDLGQVYKDIDYIYVWHYYKDNRYYKGTKTEISADGTNWITLFDSSKDGVYTETSAGHKINVNFNTYRTATTTIDDTGLHQKGGVIDVQNGVGETVIGMSDTGALNLNGEILQKDKYGKKAVSIKNNGVNIYSYLAEQDKLVGGMRYDWASYSGSFNDCCRVFGKENTPLVLGSLTKEDIDTEEGTFVDSIVIDSSKNHTNGLAEILLRKSATCIEPLTMSASSPLDFNISLGTYPKARIVSEQGTGNLLLLTHYLVNNIIFGQLTNEGYNEWMRLTDQYAIFNKEIYTDQNAQIRGTLILGGLNCTGGKNRVVKIDNGKYVCQSAYETAECYFGDIIEAETNEEGYCKIIYDPVFLQTVNTKIPYHVFVSVFADEETPIESLKDLYAVPTTKDEKYCVLKGSPNTKFSFEIKAKQIDFVNKRLEEIEL